MQTLILALAVVACATGCIGMIASVQELRITRRWIQRRDKHDKHD